ncbi:hypothetical protein WJX73_010173 [Symbiochloris irregularis]|uniref:Uncharacterized protein n=1 Tax=Symbiochloris irregularis TaxID=706552 RepID=A0AAW1NY73_9CHLO
MRAEEREIWETNLVILQDTRRMHQEELDLIDMELVGRQRLAQAAADQAEAEASGAAAISRATDQLMQMDTRIDRLKQQLYFPSVQGYNLTFGGSGAYIGMKDYQISEVAGGFSLTLDAGPSARKSGRKAGRIIMQVGAQAAPPPPGRETAPSGPASFFRPVQNSFKLRNNPGSGQQPPAHQFLARSTSEGSTEPTSDGASTSGSGRFGGLPSGPRATKGKRMAMKFLNKMSAKDKFSKHIPGLGRSSTDGSPPAEGEEGSPAHKVGAFASRLLKKKSLSSSANGRGGTPSVAEDEAYEEEEDDPTLDAEAANLPDMLDAGFAAGLPGQRRNVVEDWDAAASTTGSTEGGETGAEASSTTSGRRGLFAVVRCNDLALLGERGSKVPNATIGQLSLEIEVAMTLSLEYTSVGGWAMGATPKWEVTHLRRSAKGNSVPLPRAILRLVLAIVVPRIITRLLLTMLPPELGTYFLEADQTVYLSGEVSMVGPPLSAMDADLGFQMTTSADLKPRDAQTTVRQHAASQEARSLLGLSVDQAAVLGEVLGSGSFSIIPSQQAQQPGTRCSLQQVLTFCRVHLNSEQTWDQVASLVDSATRTVASFRGCQAPPPLHALVRSHILALLRKPVRARFVVPKVEVAISVDAALSSTRAYLERSARELALKGPPPASSSGGGASAGSPEGELPLEVQLEVLRAWHAWLLGALRHFKGKFRGSSATLIAAADCRGFATGIENCRFEGPVRLSLPVPPSLGAVDADGGFSFQLPLPNPQRQAVMSTFVDGLRAALNTPLAMVHTPDTDAANPKEARQLERTQSEMAEILKTTPLDWFSKWQESGSPTAPTSPEEEPFPAVLGTFMVNSARVRLKLDEQRISELLQESSERNLAARGSGGGMSEGAANATARILACLGDMGIASFTPGVSEEGTVRYEVKLETGEVANLAAELGSAGFKSGAGISPGRLLRVAHALGRACLLTFRGGKESAERLAELDKHCEAAYEHLVREALDGSLSLHMRSFVQGQHLLLCMSGTPADVNGGVDSSYVAGADGSWPFIVSNDVDLAPLISDVRGGLQDNN